MHKYSLKYTLYFNKLSFPVILSISLTVLGPIAQQVHVFGSTSVLPASLTI